jgi:predicted esterase
MDPSPHRHFRTRAARIRTGAMRFATALPCGGALRCVPLLVLVATSAVAGQDLRRIYHSAVDGSEQAYRLYVPSGYDASRPSPLVIALHGSGGNENSFFDDEAHYPSKDGLKHAAEQHNVLAVCPSARGNTNYRGLGEVSVFSVLEDVKKNYAVDPERVYLTGHSMGGTGATDLALHHPGVFAAVVPMAAARSIRWVAANAEHTAFWWIGGALDQEFYKLGVAVGFERMKSLGYPARFTELPGEGHYGTARDFRPVIAWLLQHRLIAHPKKFTFEIDTPLHPRAYWITAQTIAHPGKVATISASAISKHTARLELDNVAALSVWPDPAIFDPAEELQVQIENNTVFSGRVSPTNEVTLMRGAGGWNAEVQPRRELSLTDYRTHPVAAAREPLDHSGTQSRLGTWIADAMRAATGADLALYNHRVTDSDRPLPAGTVDVVDLLQCSLPGDQDLVTVELLGRELVEILDANIPIRDGSGGPAANLLVQISGANYSFDRRLAPGSRIVASSLHPEKNYVVALEGQVVERETMRLAGRFKQLRYKTTDVPFTVALYGYAARSGEIHVDLERRVSEVK